MKNNVSICIALVVLFLSAFSPRELYGDNAVGIQLGEPGTAGVSLRFDNIAIGAAWNIDNGYLHVNLDYWADRGTLAKPIDWFYGYGADVGLGDEYRVAARIPVGMIWEPNKQFEVFGQVAPGLKVLPNTDFYFGAAVGVRYRF
ncbi:MAG: hypothetical protein FJ211_03505 [Ignavibacteria bacterium]|nr:hypothetical protein [Ignavibacteria bacterium]